MDAVVIMDMFELIDWVICLELLQTVTGSLSSWVQTYLTS